MIEGLYVSTEYLRGAPSQNCQFMQQIVQSLKSVFKNTRIGVYDELQNWVARFGAATYCAQLADQPLWYFHLDNGASFQDWPE